MLHAWPMGCPPFLRSYSVCALLKEIQIKREAKERGMYRNTERMGVESLGKWPMAVLQEVANDMGVNIMDFMRNKDIKKQMIQRLMRDYPAFGLGGKL